MYVMKASLLLFFIFFPGITAFAQQVIASTGYSGSTAGLVVDWTLGEPVIDTYVGSAIALTQGMHQPSVLVTHLQNLTGSDFAVRTFPNPVNQILFIEICQGGPGVFWYELFDVTGRKMLGKAMQSNTEEIDTGGISPGVYFIRIFSTDSEHLATCKIIKQ
jgi:hypothetical protein